MDDIIFKKLEITIIATITRNPGKYRSQYEIFKEIIEDLDIKNPEDKDTLKIKFLNIFRLLPGLYDDINIIKKEEILYIAFSPQKEDIDILNININKSINDDIEKITDVSEDKMPLEIDVINFILDESKNDIYMLKFFNKKDYNKNTLLHILVLNNDYDRIKKSFDRLYEMADQKNNDDKTPIELISDTKISNLFLSELIKDNNNLECDLVLFEDKYNLESIKNSYSTNFIYLFIGTQVLINTAFIIAFFNK